MENTYTTLHILDYRCSELPGLSEAQHYTVKIQKALHYHLSDSGGFSLKWRWKTTEHATTTGAAKTARLNTAGFNCWHLNSPPCTFSSL